MSVSIDYKALVHGVSDAVIASDGRGAICLWNLAAERLFGYTQQEALGQSLDLITPERFRARHWEGYHKSIASGSTRYANDLLKVPATHKNGQTLSIAFTVALLFDEAQAVELVVAVIRDDTQRFQDERALRKRLAELEAQLASRPTNSQ
jgi:PAS domain S-box-containing protein